MAAGEENIFVFNGVATRLLGMREFVGVREEEGRMILEGHEQGT